MLGGRAEMPGAAMGANPGLPGLEADATLVERLAAALHAKGPDYRARTAHRLPDGSARFAKSPHPADEPLPVEEGAAAVAARLPLVGRQGPTRRTLDGLRVFRGRVPATHLGARGVAGPAAADARSAGSHAGPGGEATGALKAPAVSFWDPTTAARSPRLGSLCSRRRRRRMLALGVLGDPSGGGGGRRSGGVFAGRVLGGRLFLGGAAGREGKGESGSQQPGVGQLHGYLSLVCGCVRKRDAPRNASFVRMLTTNERGSKQVSSAASTSIRRARDHHGALFDRSKANSALAFTSLPPTSKTG